MTTESDFIVRNPKLIFGHLSDLIEKKCLISAHLGESNVAFLTTIVDLDKKNHVLMLDCAPSVELDDALLSSDKVLFRTNYDGIKVSFKGDAIRKVKKGGTWAFAMPIPHAIFWMQRRHFYRVRVPLSHQGSYCQVQFKAGKALQTSALVYFPLIDISISGVALLNPDICAPWAGFLNPGNKMSNCLLQLQTGASCVVTLNIVYVNEIRASVTQMQQRIGCSFEDLPLNFDSAIQLYLHDIELQQKSLS